jgi:hypothetical protein
VLRTRPYIRPEWCGAPASLPVRCGASGNRMAEFATGAMLRRWVGALWVITLTDGETVHNAFADRDFEEKPM